MKWWGALLLTLLIQLLRDIIFSILVLLFSAVNFYSSIFSLTLVTGLGWNYHIFHVQYRKKWGGGVGGMLYVGDNYVYSFSWEKMISHFYIKDFHWCLIVQIWVKLLLPAEKKSKFSTEKIATCNKIKLMFTEIMGESEHWVYYCFSACHSSYKEESFSFLSF